MALPSNPRSVVTGAGSGLGRALCIRLAHRGARLLVADVNLETARETVSLLGGADAEAVQCDVSDADSVRALAERADERLGGVDFVANNAGVAVGGAVGDIPLPDWQWIMGVNLWGVIHGCHYFVPRLKKNGSGAILNVASAAGLLTAPMMSAYNVTKAGVIAMSETLYAELAGSGIHVTVLCPTFFKTNIAASARGTDPNLRGFVEKLMARASVQADDVAKIALDAVDSRRLYALPHGDGRWMWRLKRVVPQPYYDILRSQFRKMVPAG